MAIEQSNDTIKYRDGKNVSREAAIVVIAGGTFDLATGLDLAGNAASEPVGNLRGGAFILDIQIGGGTAPSLALQRLAPDGIAWIEIDGLDAIDAGFAPVRVMLGDGAVLRFKNKTANAVTGIYARLS